MGFLEIFGNGNDITSFYTTLLKVIALLKLAYLSISQKILLGICISNHICIEEV